MLVSQLPFIQTKLKIIKHFAFPQLCHFPLLLVIRHGRTFNNFQSVHSAPYLQFLFLFLSLSVPFLRPPPPPNVSYQQQCHDNHYLLVNRFAKLGIISRRSSPPSMQLSIVVSLIAILLKNIIAFFIHFLRMKIIWNKLKWVILIGGNL